MLRNVLDNLPYTHEAGSGIIRILVGSFESVTFLLCPRVTQLSKQNNFEKIWRNDFDSSDILFNGSVIRGGFETFGAFMFVTLSTSGGLKHVMKTLGHDNHSIDFSTNVCDAFFSSYELVHRLILGPRTSHLVVASIFFATFRVLSTSTILLILCS